MTEVQLAMARGLDSYDELVLIKTLRKRLANDPEVSKRFLAEARLSARLDHPNLVKVREVLETPVPRIITEHADGQTMSMIYQFASERFTVTMQLRVISTMLAGLHHAHELRDYDGTPLNLVHGDIGPHNVLVTYDGVVKVRDFGLARAVDPKHLHKAGMSKGRLAHMPREQLLGEAIDRRADVYAVGCMLWRAATGTKLWSDASERDIIRSVTNGAVPRPSSKRSVDPVLERIILRALAFDPEDRYATALELRGDLERYLERTAPSTTLREFARFVSDLFREEREKLTQTIQASITSPSSEPPRPAAGKLSSKAPRWAMSSWLYGTLLAVGLALVAGWGAAAAYFAARSRSSGAPSMAGSVATHPAPQPSLVTLHLSVSPRDAHMTLDGKAIAGNPAVLRVPRDDRTHELRATSTGYEPIARTIRFERNLFLELALRRTMSQVTEPSAPRPTAARPRSDKPPAPRPRPQSKAEPEAGAGACNPPFYLENGVQHPKPECL